MAMTQKTGMDRHAVIWTYTYGTKEYSYAIDLKWIRSLQADMDPGCGSGVWIACESGVWIGTLHFELRP
jgi:hypothetical protein